MMLTHYEVEAYFVYKLVTPTWRSLLLNRCLKEGPIISDHLNLDKYCMLVFVRVHTLLSVFSMVFKHSFYKVRDS